MTLVSRIEDGIQKQIIAYIEAVVPRAMVWACPNGSKRSVGGRPANAVPGLRKGAPDLIAALPGGRVLHIEVKSPKGRASDEQTAFHGRLRAIGHDCIVARGIEDVRRAFEAIGVETREIND